MSESVDFVGPKPQQESIVAVADKEAAIIMPKTPDTRTLPAFARGDSEVIYCGDNLDQLPPLPDARIEIVWKR